MGIDRQLKRFFPLVLCSALAGAAYFQASGIGQLLASSVANTGNDAPAPPTGSPLAGLAAPDRKSGQPILARNPFDSVTGPLDGSAPSPDDEDEGEVEDDEGAPTEVSDGDPKCSFGKVILISAAEDPAWSFASIQDQSGDSKLRRMGDAVNGHTVQAMSWDTVWLEDSSKKRCQLRLGDEGPAPATKARAKRQSPRSRGRGRQLPPEMAAKITKVSDTEFNIERSLVDELLQDQAQLMRSARIIPDKSGDDVVGIKLFGVRKGTLLDHLGIKNGDRLESINGFQMSDPQKALEAYGRLRSANKLSVKINRGGKPQSLDFNIQ